MQTSPVVEQYFLPWALGIIGFLVAIVGFFIMRWINKADDTTKELKDQMSETSKQLTDSLTANNKALTSLEITLASLTDVIKRVERDQHDNVVRQDKVIELVRKRVHYILNKVTAIKLALMSSGIKMGDEPWNIPDDE